MTSAANIQESTKAIRRRLWILLLKAFGLVVLLILILTLSSTLITLSMQSRYNPFYEAPMVFLLETYYQANESWADVHTLFEGQRSLDMSYLESEWRQIILLDEDSRVVVDRGKIDSPLVGYPYNNQGGERIVLLKINEQIVGKMVIERSIISLPLRLGLQVLLPIVPISFILGLLTVVIGLFLMRRVVDPLSDVIAASACVSSGDFSTRVPLHRHRDDLYALSTSFNQMADSLERSDNQRRAMLADVAHELRTPLSILRGRMEGIVDGIYPADEQHIATALEEVYLLERLVDDLRLLTLAEERQLPLELREVDLAGLAAKTEATFSAEADELEIQLTTLITPDGSGSKQSLSALGDPQRIEQVVGNLVGNALRYVPSGGRVYISVTKKTGLIRLAVSDNGPGVPEAELPFVFDRFWRGEKARSRSAGGAGLGLAIARQLIGAMGGEISARNLEEGGFEVWFELPAVK